MSKRRSKKGGNTAANKYKANPKSGPNSDMNGGAPNTESETGSKTESGDSNANPGSQGRNDVAWYAKFPELVRTASNIPYSLPFGAYTDGLDSYLIGEFTDGLVKISRDNFLQRDSEPGIVTLVVKPSLGGSDSSNDAANIGAYLLFESVRAKISGSRKYTQCDLMIYTLAVSELLSYIFWMKRLYNVAFVQSQRNYFINGLLDALGGDISLTGNLAQFRSWINYFITKVSTLVVPANIEIFKRRAFMYEAIYTESTEGSIMDQLYAFTPACFMKFQYDSAGAGCLEPYWPSSVGETQDLSQVKMQLSDIEEIGNALLENIVNNEDFSIIAGDLARAFETNILVVELQPEDGYIIPVYDTNVLAQMHNADIVQNVLCGNKFIGNPHRGEYTSTFKPADFDRVEQGYKIPIDILHSDEKLVHYGGVYQDGNNLLRCREAAVIRTYDSPSYTQDTVMLGDHLILGADKLIFSPYGDMSCEFTIEATRLKVTSDADAFETYQFVSKSDPTSFTGNYTIKEFKCGSDIVVNVKYYVQKTIYNAGNLVSKGMMSMSANSNYKVSTSKNFDINLELFSGAIHGHWFPWTVFVGGERSNLSDNNITFTISNVLPVTCSDTFTVQDPRIIQRLTDICMLSLCAVSTNVVNLA